jgi:polar amino acid transport system substrate-binding protein
LLELLTSKQADAAALSREAAAALSAKLPGSRVLDGAFWKSYVAIAEPAVKGSSAIVVPATRDPAVLPYLSAFVDEAIASGKIRRSLDNVGMQKSIVPRPGTRP